ncbi:LOB domain-containing protein 1-like [Hibiscus syriacus]|uniref:LOB domain-containing protein 1-like n=1 Tax=Hibiscus syriacus TaxID=106335 RepID=UPI0019207FA6|nr:LOB domain-containing protein 1-like [Hibiscus syriacus]
MVSSTMGSEIEITPARAITHQPCAACRMLRRRCDVNCILAPYFPGDEPEKFAVVHKVFGASNVIKMIQMVEERNREDAAKALVYEAKARMRDPVYGSTGTIFQLQKMVQQLKVQLESTNARVLELQQQKDQLLSIFLDVDLHSLVDYGGSFSLDCEDSMAYDPSKFPVV